MLQTVLKTFFEIINSLHTEILNILVEWIEEISVRIDKYISTR